MHIYTYMLSSSLLGQYPMEGRKNRHILTYIHTYTHTLTHTHTHIHTYPDVHTHTHTHSHTHAHKHIYACYKHTKICKVMGVYDDEPEAKINSNPLTI